MNQAALKKTEKIESLDFSVGKFYSYSGPNYYIDRPAMVFNVFIDPKGPNVDFYRDRIVAKFPKMAQDFPSSVVDVFAETISNVMKMDLDLFVGKYTIARDGEEWTIAVEHLDDYLAKDVVYFVSDWFNAINNNDNSFDFDTQFAALQDNFNRTLYGGPTIYSLIEAGVKRGIPVHYLYEENQFQWGYGKTQVRGRSTVLHVDGIKDTEFTTYKDMVGEFLEVCGLPTPKGKACNSLEELIEEAHALGFPVVVKPVDGHKGQGVTTGIENDAQVEKALKVIMSSTANGKIPTGGVLVQRQIYGYDHRLVTVGGKFAAALKRIPAYVVGNGKNTIKELIDVENLKEVRADTARSPLCKIKLDEDMLDFMKKQNLSPETIPAEGQEIVLRRVANISAGGVSINVTKDMHPKNIEMVENISRFFNVNVMGIDVLAKDISQPWTAGNFGIIEINAGPGVFMHLAPAEGGAVDIPGKIMEHLFGTKPGAGRIPIIAGNNISDNLIQKIVAELKQHKENVNVSSLSPTGVWFNDVFLCNNESHSQNCKLVFRDPKADIAILNHNYNDIYDYGIWHRGMDVTILNHPHHAEYILEKDLADDGLFIEIAEQEIVENNSQVSATEAKVTTAESKLEQLQNLNNADLGKIIAELKNEIQELKNEVKKVTVKTKKTELFVRKGKTELQRQFIEPNTNLDELIFNILKPHLKEVLFKF